MFKYLEIFTFHNRLNRANFWAYRISIAALCLIISFPLLLINGPLCIIIFALINLGFLIKLTTLNISRLHDRGRSGWLLLCEFVPVVGSIYLFAQVCLRGKDGANKYGEPQKPGFKSRKLKNTLILSIIILPIALIANLIAIGKHHHNSKKTTSQTTYVEHVSETF